MNKIKVVLNYDTEIDPQEFDDVDGERLGEMMGQESITEFLNCLDEIEKEAKVVLVDEAGKVLKSKLVKIF